MTYCLVCALGEGAQAKTGAKPCLSMCCCSEWLACRGEKPFVGGFSIVGRELLERDIGPKRPPLVERLLRDDGDFVASVFVMDGRLLLAERPTLRWWALLKQAVRARQLMCAKKAGDHRRRGGGASGHRTYFRAASSSGSLLSL